MKPLLIFALLCALPLNSCETARKVVHQISDSYIYISPMVQLAGTVLLNEAVSDEDRVAKAEIMLKVADKLSSIPVNHKLSKEELQTILDKALPEKAHWKTLSEKVVKYYGQATANIADEDVIDVIAILAEVSDGLEKAVANKK